MRQAVGHHDGGAASGPAANAPAALLELRGVTKRFGSLTACDGIDLSVRPGEVLALLGENGAGKSTLMKTVFGVHPADGGAVLLDGTETHFSSPRDAMAARIGMVFQSFALIDALSVRENLALAWPGSPWRLGRRAWRARGALDNLSRLAPAIDPDRRVGDLSVAEQQLVELAKVLNLDARIVILDEPTAVLTPAEARRLHDQIRRLAATGVAVVIITHKLADVDAVGDRVAVLRRGKVVASGPARQFSRTQLVAAMMGDDSGVPQVPAPRASGAVPRLVLKDVAASAARGTVAGIDLSIAGREILGIAGVSGNGQSTLAEAAAGVLPITGGEILLDGVDIARRAGDRPRKLAIGYLPEEPRFNAIAGALDLSANLRLRALAEGRRGPGKDADKDLLDAYDVRPPDPSRRAGTLSGGNLQKLVVAREFSEPHPAIVLAFPTMGLDVRASAAVYRHMTDAAEQGAAVLWISEEIDDLLQIAHRIAVLYEGRVVADLPNDGTLDRERLGVLMTGGTT